MSAPWIETASGVAFDLLAPTAEMVRDLMAPCERDWCLPEYAPASAPCGRLHGYEARPTMTRGRIDGSTLCAWQYARDRFAAYLAELDAQIAGST